MSNLSVQELIGQFKYLINIGAILYPAGKSVFMIVRVDSPEGPVTVKRKRCSDSTPWNAVPEVSISSQMLWRVVNALRTGLPIQIDRVVGASYNSRSVLEAMIACCSNFFMCRPKRMTLVGTQTTISENSHKYLIWRANETHEIGNIQWIDLDGYITEVPSKELYFDAQNLDPIPATSDKSQLDPTIRRLHSQMQVLLSHAANWMNMRSWVAVEDHGIITGGKNLLSYPFMVKELEQERVISNYPEAIKVAKHIDCIWFNGGMPFVFEVEHTTGVTSGLTRMQRLHEKASHSATDYVIVAPDEDREKVLQKADAAQYDDLSLWYLSYSSLIELSEFSKKHAYRCGIKGKGNFTKMFMEQIHEAS